MCLYEKTIENRRYKANKKMAGLFPLFLMKEKDTLQLDAVDVWNA